MPKEIGMTVNVREVDEEEDVNEIPAEEVIQDIPTVHDTPSNDLGNNDSNDENSDAYGDLQNLTPVSIELTTVDGNHAPHTNGSSKEPSLELESIRGVVNDSASLSSNYSDSVSDAVTEVDEFVSSNLYYARLIKEYTPPSVLVDKEYVVHSHTRKIYDIIALKTNNLATDFFSKIPDYDRLRIQEAILDSLASKDAKEKNRVKLLNAGHLEEDLIAEVSYFGLYADDVECAHIVFTTAAKESKGDHDEVDSKAEESDPGMILSKLDHKGNIEDSYLHVIASAPFPILIHAEGGKIIESSPAWYYMAGVKKSEARTITEWIRKVRGHRITLKDQELKKVYEEKGVVCISIQTINKDTKLLAFHSYFLGKDSRGRKLTLTMAVDITTYPGHAGMGITPESADYGVAAKKAFLANMSHEVRTPLTSMIGFADYLADNLEGQDVQFARYISESGNRLLETLNAVLRIASVKFPRAGT